MSVPTYQSNKNLVLNNSFGSNVNNSTVLTSFPVATSTALGHYHFTGSNNQLKFLNASNDKAGGHEFWNVSASNSPQLLFNIKQDGIFLDTAIKNSTNKTVLNLASNELTFTNDLSVQTQGHEAFKFIYNGAVNTQINNSPENPNIYFQSQTNNSQLSASDLKFDGISVLTTLTNLKIKQKDILNIYPAPPIYADGHQPLSVPNIISNTYGQFGWYYINSNSGPNKINWYLPPNNNMLVGDILGFYLRLFNCSTTSNDNTPFIVIYTKPTGVNDYAPWFHSSMTYVLNSSVTPVPNTSYTFFENVSGTCPNPSSYASQLVDMQQSSVNNPRGVYLATDQILAISVQTNSASPVNSVEFVAQSLGLMTASGTTEFQFGFQL